MKYYKILYTYSLVLFCLDEENDCISQMVKEIKTDTVSTVKFEDVSCFTHASINPTVKALLEKAHETTKTDFEVAVEIVKCMVNPSADWLISDYDYLDKTVKTEIVYV